MLANYSRAWSLPWWVVDINSDTPLEKVSSPFASGDQLQIASWLGWNLLSAGICLASPSTGLECVVTVSVSS